MKTNIFIFLLLSLPTTLLAGNVLDKVGNPTATSVAAFSVRLLSSAYAGKCMNVRRSSDNTFMDIPFTANGDLDTATLKTFVGSGTGYVHIWYDQSGAGLDAAQNTNGLQPTIVTSGTVNRENGQPSVWTLGATGFLHFQPIPTLTSTVTRMSVVMNTSGGFAIVEGLGQFQMDMQLWIDHPMTQYQTGSFNVNGAIGDSTNHLMSLNEIRSSGNLQLYYNTIAQTPNPTAVGTLFTPDSGYIGVRWDYFTGNTGNAAFGEVIYFSSVLSNADRQSINYNENWYYSLGFDPCSSTTLAYSANGTTSRALYACTQDGPYAYYYDPSSPLNLLFGIAKDPGGTGANASFVVDSVKLTVTSNPSAVLYSAESGQEAIYALGRYWNVYSQTPLTSPVNIRFFYKPADTLAAYDSAVNYKAAHGSTRISGLQWFKTVGTPFTPGLLTATPTANITGPRISLTPIYNTESPVNYVEFDGVTSFSGGTGVYIVSSSMVVLPINLADFTGRRENETTVLSWTTQSESNSRQFDIGRSADGNTWTTIGQVPAAGNSNTPLSYQYTDPVSLPAGGLYYRLQLEDIDGKDAYSNIVYVSDNATSTLAPKLISMAPNPFADELTITSNVPASGPVEVRLVDMTGATLVRQTYTASKGVNVFRLTNLKGLSRGMYILKIVQNGTAGIGKVIRL
jgi:hypothetical protein